MRLVRLFRVTPTGSGGVPGLEQAGRRLDTAGSPLPVGRVARMVRIDDEQCKEDGFTGVKEKLRRKSLKVFTILLLKRLLR